MKNLQLRIAHENSRAEQEKSSLQKALDDRLTPSEAIETAAKLLDQFPNSKNSGDGFIGAISTVLSSYPRYAVHRCCDPITGIASVSDFLTISVLVAHCEKETEPMRVAAAREIKVREQLRLRDEWNQGRNKRFSANEITYKGFLEHCEKTGQKPRPIGAFEDGGYLGKSE